METKIFNIKQDSISKFFKENVMGYEKLGEEEDHNYREEESKYNWMKDELRVKKGVVAGTHVDIHLRDESRSGAILQHEYSYEVEKYDDVHDSLILRDFKINVVDHPKLKNFSS